MCICVLVYYSGSNIIKIILYRSFFKGIGLIRIHELSLATIRALWLSLMLSAGIVVFELKRFN